jgi:hypothetical protein
MDIDPSEAIAYIRVGQDDRGSCCWEVVDGDLVVRTVSMSRARQILADRWAKCDESSTGEGRG